MCNSHFNLERIQCYNISFHSLSFRFVWSRLVVPKKRIRRKCKRLRSREATRLVTPAEEGKGRGLTSSILLHSVGEKDEVWHQGIIGGEGADSCACGVPGSDNVHRPRQTVAASGPPLSRPPRLPSTTYTLAAPTTYTTGTTKDKGVGWWDGGWRLWWRGLRGNSALSEE